MSAQTQQTFAFGDKVRLKHDVRIGYKSVQRAFEQSNYRGIVTAVNADSTPPMIKVRAMGSIEWDWFEAEELTPEVSQ